MNINEEPLSSVNELQRNLCVYLHLAGAILIVSQEADKGILK